MEPLFRICGLSEVWQGKAENLLGGLLPKGRVVAVVDSKIAQLYPDFVGRFERVEITPSEEEKTLQTVEYLCCKFIEMGVDRSTFVLGIGGGITTDIAGFVASVYMRGMKFGFVSTSLLGQVDASVGGKNGVNLDGYKNMIGVFSQPQFVICDPDFLQTLPEREFRAGMAEVVKSAVIGDGALFEKLEGCTLETLREGRELLAEAIAGAIRLKAQIVSRDEREAGERRKLNLGHTFGHAIEKCSREMSHGEAVAVGLRLVVDAAVKMNRLSFADCGRILGLLSRLGFVLNPPVEMAKLKAAAMKDKKQSRGVLNLVVPTGIGSCEVMPLRHEEFERLF